MVAIYRLSNKRDVDYVGNMIHENGSLKRILADGCYIENGVYHFCIQDHLGEKNIVDNTFKFIFIQK